MEDVIVFYNIYFMIEMDKSIRNQVSSFIIEQSKRKIKFPLFFIEDEIVYDLTMGLADLDKITLLEDI